MPKNDIFGSIENNEFIKNLVEDSKKLFDDFLGLAQGKKIKEGFTNDGSSEKSNLKYSYLSAIEVTNFEELKFLTQQSVTSYNYLYDNNNIVSIDACKLLNMMKNIESNERGTVGCIECPSYCMV